MAKEIKDLKKGDTMLIVRNYATKNGPRPATIESIGRIWINLNGGLRVDKQTLKGEMITGYVDSVDYENKMRLRKLRVMAHNRLKDMTDDQMIQIGEIMGISLNEIPIIVDDFAV